ncbi:MAG: hypothetical protein FJX71_01875 [Alphaproteobacteria bacterium]|nr:hypothetical protein [Alphaproteobacteria bacterium]
MNYKNSKCRLSLFIFLIVITPPSGVAEEIVKQEHLSPQVIDSLSTEQDIQQNLPEGWPKTGLLVFPEAGRDPWIKAIRSAKTSIKMAAYRLSDQAIVDTLVAIAQEGKVKVSLLIQPETFQHDKSGTDLSPLKMLKQKGIKVYHLSARFNQAHYKMILVDEKWAMVSSGNLDASSFDGIKDISNEPCRDFALTVTNAAMVKELSRMFDADISDARTWSKHPQLVWGPDNQRSIFLQMITSAKKSIRIYQQDFQDVGLAQAVAGAARAGVNVEVIMMPFPFSKKEDKNIPNQDLIRNAGGKVYLHLRHYMHAKAMIIDDQIMYVGSCNFYPPSLDQTRELGLLTSSREQIEEVTTIFEKDRS